VKTEQKAGESAFYLALFFVTKYKINSYGLSRINVNAETPKTVNVFVYKYTNASY